jgi:hypothetical protein
VTAAIVVLSLAGLAVVAGDVASRRLHRVDLFLHRVLGGR